MHLNHRWRLQTAPTDSKGGSCLTCLSEQICVVLHSLQHHTKSHSLRFLLGESVATTVLTKITHSPQKAMWLSACMRVHTHTHSPSNRSHGEIGLKTKGCICYFQDIYLYVFAHICDIHMYTHLCGSQRSYCFYLLKMYFFFFLFFCTNLCKHMHVSMDIHRGQWS